MVEEDMEDCVRKDGVGEWCVVFDGLGDVGGECLVGEGIGDGIFCGGIEGERFG